ncbi:hypothetical protein F2Q68_00040437 [Brassica cretica]|uniref:B box-type domain-containing protein n=1 Tax=Brassica cretica TaxID=69181 RepID=A0A8S9MA99_BRACR|nr:hypothetical protein F2Q68_00040437 [Brassica cretica]
MYCESDQASLCWNCDGKVHGANFLVAKHTRCLLCTSCQSLTPWKATGLRLGPTFSDEIGSSSSAQELNYSPPLKRPSREGPASKSTAAVNSLISLEGEISAVDSSPSSSYSLIVAIPKTRRDLSR